MTSCNNTHRIVITTCSTVFAVAVFPVFQKAVASLLDDYDDALQRALDLHRATKLEITDEVGPNPWRPA